MSLSIEALIQAASAYIEDVTTRANLIQNLRTLGLSDADDGSFKSSGIGKKKYTEKLLRDQTFDSIYKILIEALNRFKGVEDRKLTRETLIKLTESKSDSEIKLYFSGAGKPDIIIKDLARGTLEVIDYKGCLELSTNHRSTIMWSSLFEVHRDKFEKYNDLITHLRRSIPENSLQAKMFFETYICQTLAKRNLSAPALLPELNLHYDPMTKKFRGGIKALDSQRCDFYMKLPNREIIIEVDGIQHYTRKD
ncbi:hypothetical protein SAMN04488058_10886 [Deinococcus reticulitermitis]|uniref:Uncharacterized protein n=1 Tax=Deinococcus reticulitermitis TaxID=856736 RepID=A0A1H6Z7T7_9DEIO|nr:hypothetical protein [Deinococcus reticulitermitis]SEJ45025.1 hypothetical protein SAMN04488058_10886 [Deinococcus reticulitermitis]